MTVEKIDDPAGLWPSKIHIKFDGGKNDLAAFKSCLMANTPRARIEKLKRHKELIELANALESRLVDGQADLHLLLDISTAEKHASHFDDAPLAESAKRQSRGFANDRREKLLRTAERQKNIHSRADELINQAKPYREIIGIIARETVFTSRTIRRYLEKHPSGHWKPKVKKKK